MKSSGIGAAVVYLDERADDAERGEAQVLERTVRVRRIEEGVEEERHVRLLLLLLFVVCVCGGVGR